MLARSLDAQRKAQQSLSVEILRRLDALAELRLAFGQRACLVDDERVDFLQRSSASAFLITTPASLARPTPTMIDIGVASPESAGAGDDQHGHGVDERVGNRAAAGPHTAQAINVSTADLTTTGTNQLDPGPPAVWTGARLRAARSATMSTICDKHACRCRPSRPRITNAPV